MSRCFPYPPPGYTLTRDSEAALIKSIKLHKEREKDQKKNNHRREKKEKRKHNTLKLHNNEELINGKLWPATNGKLVDDYASKVETESLERSGLSQENGLPVRLLVPSSSSDSTENSNKRKRPSSPIALPPRPGKIIRIKLSKKQSGADSLGDEQNPCSTSGQVAEPCYPQNKRVHDLRSQIEDLSQNLHLETPGEHRFSTSHQSKSVDATKTKAAALPLLDKHTRKRQKSYLKYKKLIENWVPPTLLEAPVHSDGDLDWLFKSKDKEYCQPQKEQISNGDSVPCSSNNGSVSWPCAHFLPEVGVYALPYTVPF